MVSPEICEQVLDACMKEKKRFVSLLRKLVVCESPSNRPKLQKRLLTILKTEFEKTGCQVTLFPGKHSGGQLLARTRISNHSECGYQLMLGHADTVWPEGTLNKMPWTIENNIFSGPGIFDMKAGLTMMVTALRVLQKLELKPKVQPVVFINSDEETGSRESYSHIVKLAKIMKRVYVLEPSLDSDGKLKTRRKGVGHFDIAVKGVSSHAGIEPEKGRSAIHELSLLIQKLFELNDPEHGITVNVGKIDGGISGNVIAPESSASVDVRVLTKTDAEKIEKKIKSLKPEIQGTTLHITGGFNRPPLVRNSRNRALWRRAKKISGHLGIELKEGISGGGSDGSITSLHTATLDGLGAVGEGAHSPTEKILLEETLRRCALMALLLMAPEIKEK